MIARLLAPVCLLYVSVPSVWGQYLGDGDVAVYLKTGPVHSAPAVLEMKSELETLMRSVGVNIKWWAPHDAAPLKDSMVVLELRGSCEPPHRAAIGPPLEDETSLASTAIADGRILPFSALNCDALSRFIGRSLIEMPSPQGDYLYGRALARLAAHEFYHVLSKKSSHAPAGIAKAKFTSADLLAGHLGFADTIVAKVRTSSSPVDPSIAEK